MNFFSASNGLYSSIFHWYIQSIYFNLHLYHNNSLFEEGKKWRKTGKKDSLLWNTLLKLKKKTKMGQCWFDSIHIRMYSMNMLKVAFKELAIYCAYVHCTQTHSHRFITVYVFIFFSIYIYIFQNHLGCQLKKVSNSIFHWVNTNWID